MAASAPSARSAALAGLLARTALADQVAFAELYRQTSAHLYAVALRILREPAMAEETLQEVFVSVWHHAGSYSPAKSQPQTWLASIVRNRCLDRLRRREPDTVTLTRDDADTPEIDLPAEGRTPVDAPCGRRGAVGPRVRRRPRRRPEAGDRPGVLPGTHPRRGRAPSPAALRHDSSRGSGAGSRA